MQPASSAATGPTSATSPAAHPNRRFFNNANAGVSRTASSFPKLTSYRDRLPRGRGIGYPQGSIISMVKPPIAGKETVGGNQRMCADQKIGRNPVARTSTCSVSAPSSDALSAASSVIGENEADSLFIASRKPSASPNTVAVSAHTTSEATNAPSLRQRRNASEEAGANFGSAPNTSSRTSVSMAVITAGREAAP